jgi:hypothetical protein
MKAKRRVLTEMIKKTGWSSQALREIKVKFWLSKEYTIYPKEHHGLEVIKTETLTDDTIILGTKEQVLTYKQ